MNRAPNALLVLALLLAIFAGGMLWVLSDRIASTGEASTGAEMGGPFALTDQNGAHRSDRDFRGRFVLLYFGYSYCPDVCPTTLGVMAEALSRLGPKAARVVPVFVSVDPERDTPAELKKYLAAFGPQFVGLTGSVAEVKKVAREYGIYFAKQPIKGGGYSVDHSSVVFLLGPDGKLVKYYDGALTPDQLEKDLAPRI